MHPLNGALPGPYVPVRVTCGALVAHRHTYARLAAGPFSTAGLLVPSRCPSGTILLPPIRWCGTGGFQEQGHCFFIGLGCSIHTIVFYSFSLSLLSFYRLVLWGWGLRPDRVYITLSQPYAADLFNKNKNKNNNNNKIKCLELNTKSFSL